LKKKCKTFIHSDDVNEHLLNNLEILIELVLVFLRLYLKANLSWING